MKILLNLFAILSLLKCCQQFVLENNYSVEISPLKPTFETLIQNFKCNSESKVKEMNYFKQFSAKISCNDWSFRKMNTTFNITVGEERHELQLKNMDTVSAHVNGHLIYSQSGAITEGICAGGKFDKLVFNKVEPNSCDKEGADLQTTVYASVRIDGGFCEAFCYGDVTVQFSPGITN